MEIKSIAREVYARIYREFFIRDEFDRIRGTETSLNVNRRRLRLGSSALSYEPTRPEIFAKACHCLPPEAMRYPFVDLGSGKGRVLILAYEHGFQQIIGVELSSSLIKTCRRNLSKVGITNVAIANEDVATFAFPDSPLVVYMYNPFRPPLLNSIVDRLIRHQHPLFLIYVNPKFRDVIDQTGRFSTILDFPTYPGLLVSFLIPHSI